MPARNPHDDFFEDITNRSDAGVFGGLGIDDYESVKESVSPQGLQIKMSCRACGKEHDVTLEWQELFLAGSNGPGLIPILPQGWAYSQNNGSLYPANVLCTKCRAPLCPQITPDDARQRVNDAVGRGLIPMQSIAQWQRQVDMYRSQGG